MTVPTSGGELGDIPLRDLSGPFLDAMRAKLEAGRRKGYIDWDTHWGTTGPWYLRTADECTPTWFVMRIQEELVELIAAVQSGDINAITSECADIANFAMMCADVCTERDTSKEAAE